MEQNESVGPVIPSNIINTDDITVTVLCMQLLDASLRLLPVSELIESLQSLLARTEDNVSQYSWCLRPSSLPASDPATNTAIIRISPQR